MGILYSQLFVKPKLPDVAFTGQTVIVTGSNVGLGKEAARHFAQMGAAKLILAVRNVKAGEEARRDIKRTVMSSPTEIEVWPLDLSSSASIKAFAHRASELRRIDVLLENAGVASSKNWYQDGEHERMISVNVIGTFYLALLLLPKLKLSAKEFKTTPHLTIVTSEVHAFSKFPEWKQANTFAALNDRTKSKIAERYPTSKLLEVLAVREIAPELNGTGVILNMVNPGLCHSELAREGDTALVIAKFLLARPTEMGSRTLVCGSAAGSDSHGKYMSDGKVNENALSKFVRSEDGKKASAKVWRELSEILEDIQPGVTSYL